jgi:hypothetical protein
MFMKRARRPAPAGRTFLRWRWLSVAGAMAAALGAGMVSAETVSVASLSLVSGPSPFSPGCEGAAQNGTNHLHAEAEPWVDVNPTDPDNIIGVFQQDRWSNGGARGLVTAVSHDEGATWTRTFAHFSRCSGGNAANGGDYERASDPWVSFAPNGDAHQVALTLNDSNPTNAVLVSKSTDGGDTWSEPITLIRDTSPTAFNDKESLTADPTDAEGRRVYVVWDRVGFSEAQVSATIAEQGVGVLGPTWFTRTMDGGASWEPARMIFNPGLRSQTIGNQIVVLPDGTLVNGFTLISNLSGVPRLRGTTPETAELDVAVIRSTDQGATWSRAITVNAFQQVPVADPETGELVRAGEILADFAVDRRSGALYAVWPDARFNGGNHNGIAFSTSTDGGLTWSAPARINPVPDVAAFTPAVHVADDGTIGVSYFDFRNDTSETATLVTDHWLAHSHDGGRTWSETRLGGSFDLKTAPDAGGFFIGDYHGLASVGNRFLPLFIKANSGDAANRTDAFVARLSP